MTSHDLIFTLLQFAAFVVVGYSTGALFMVGKRGEGLEGFSWPERLLAIVPGFVLFAVALMIGNILSGGLVFGTPGVVPALAVVLIVFGWRRERTLPDAPWLLLAVFAAVLCVIYLAPILMTGSGVRTGDPPWHLGWTQQLLHGLSVPVGPAPEIARNSYPWGLHAVLATLTRLVPGSDPLIGHESLNIALLFSIPLAGACLARRLDERAGWFGAAATSLIGGFGWIAAGTSRAFIASPSEFRYGADLVVASPNSVYELFGPALPRELGLVLLATAGCTCVMAVRNNDRTLAIVTGVLAGLAGLVNLPMFLSALAWIILSAVFAAKGTRLRLTVTMVGAAALTIAPWASMVIFNYIKFGGFLDTTPLLGVEWPLDSALWAWGILGFLALAGLLLILRRKVPADRVVLGFLAGSVVMLAAAVLRKDFGWEVMGNATILHQGRTWPPLHLLGGAFGGYALMVGFLWLKERSSWLAVATGIVVIGFGAISPVVASRGYTDVLEDSSKGFIYSSDDYDADSFLRRAAEHLSPDDVVRVQGADDLAFALFQFSGVRIAAFDDPRLAGNDLRIRYVDLARQYDDTIASGGYEADYLVVPLGRNGLVRFSNLEAGEFEGESWVLLKADKP